MKFSGCVLIAFREIKDPEPFYVSSHSMEITNHTLTHFGKKFRESNIITKEITKELIWRNFFQWEKISRFSTLCTYSLGRSTLCHLTSISSKPNYVSIYDWSSQYHKCFCNLKITSYGSWGRKIWKAEHLANFHTVLSFLATQQINQSQWKMSLTLYMVDNMPLFPLSNEKIRQIIRLYWFSTWKHNEFFVNGILSLVLLLFVK